MPSHIIRSIAVLLLASIWMPSLCSKQSRWKEIRVEKEGVDNRTCLSQVTSMVPCRSLFYAFSHIQSYTRIRIGCGTHEVGSINSFIQITPSTLVGIHIQGYCMGPSMLPVVQCANGSHLVFKRIENITVEGLRLHNCRGPQTEVGKRSGTKFYSVYFDMCSTITMRDVELILTENNNSDGIGCILPLISVRFSNIYILQVNGWGNAISMGINCSNTPTTSITNVGILRQGYNPPLSVMPPSEYYGISIGMYTGTGQMRDVYMGSHKVSVSNVSIVDSGAYHSSAGGVSVTLPTGRNTIMLKNISVVSGWQRALDMAFKPISQALLFCENNSTTISEEPTADSMVTNSTISAGIQIYAENGTDKSFITVENSLVSHCRIWPGFATTVPAKLWHWSYEHIANNTYSQTLNTVLMPPSRRGGLNITIAGNSTSKENSISVASSVFAYNHAKFGGGICVSFSQQTHHNTVDIRQAIVAFNWAKSGGGVFIDYQDRSRRNNAIFHHGHIIGNQAMYYGAGMFLIFQDKVTSNLAFLKQTNVVHNILLQSNIQGRMGGGVHIGFETDITDFSNMVKVVMVAFFHNQAVGATGGGLSLFHYGNDYTYLQRSDEYSLKVLGCVFNNNTAAFGQAIALEALPIHGKRFYNGIELTSTTIQYSDRDLLQTQNILWQEIITKNGRKLLETWHQRELEMLQKPLHRSYNPDVEEQLLSSGQGTVYMKAVTVQVDGHFFVDCGGSSQGIVAVESEINIERRSDFRVQGCVALHGGGVALLGESYIRISEDVHMEYINNYAFNRGGAIYANFVQLQANSFSCFLQYSEYPVLVKDWWHVNITFINNRAKAEGNSIYVTDIQTCLLSRLTNNFDKYSIRNNTKDHIFTSSPPFCFIPAGCASTCEQLSEESNCSHHGEVVSRPSQVLGWSSNAKFIPGKQTIPLFEAVADDMENVVSTAFTVQVTSQNSLIKVNPFSRFTSDSRVILHGTPINQTTILLNSSEFHRNKATLTLQSVDNSNLLILVDIEMQCCPPGYIFKDEDHLGTCFCAASGLQGITECKQDSLQAVLDKDHWAGYLQSDSTIQHTCNGLKFFAAPCPPGYCSPSMQHLPQNQSKELLEDLLCAPNKRRGVLCGECMEGHSIPANLNGLNPLCTKCDGALSRAGIIVWIVSEWLPMFILLAFMLIFNVDLISGKLNSFLLFAQLLSFSNIRGEAEIGLWGYTWFVKLYRFLYGIWNLEFLGVFLPPYCFTATASLSTLQMLLLNYAIGLFPLTVTIILVVLDRSAEKWICCHPVDQCLRRLRKWKTKIANERSYDRALADFVILGFTRFMVTSAYILVRQNITAYDGTTESRVWWQGSTHYGSADHIAALIPAVIIIALFVVLPSFLLLALPLFPQVLGRMIFYSKIKCIKKLQFIPTFCSNVYTDRWVYHFVNVLQGCYKDRFRCFASFFLFYRIVQLFAVIFTPRAEDALFIQLLTAFIFVLMIAAFQPYKEQTLNTVDTAITANYALILLLSMHKSKESTPLTYKQACSIIQLILIYLPLIYLVGLVVRKVWAKYPPSQCRKKNNLEDSLNESLLIEDPRQGLGGLVNITELRAGLPQDDINATATGSLTDSRYTQEEEASTNI